MAGRGRRGNEAARTARAGCIRTIASWASVVLIVALALWGCVAAVRGDSDDPPTDPSPGEDSPAPQRPSQMPGVVCDNLATADSVLTNRGIYAEYQDATSEDRVPFDYANWIVVAQTPGPGDPPGDDPVLAVVKLGEPSGC